MNERDAREKEIKRLMFLKNELIKQQKKELQALRDELLQLSGERTLERNEQKAKRKHR